MMGRLTLLLIHGINGVSEREEPVSQEKYSYERFYIDLSPVKRSRILLGQMKR